MAKRNLLLCFDAFGTLFRIKQPIEQQYGDIARQQFGLSGFTDEQLRASFRAAFKAESKAHPIYGRTSSLGPSKWWTNVINAAFRPLLSGDLPPGLAPRLLERFASNEGYTMASHLPELLRSLHRHYLSGGSRFYDRVVVGVITNSDDRVPGILSSFGLRVSPVRSGAVPFGGKQDTITLKTLKNEPSTGTPPPLPYYDIDFHCMSYDVGVEKPDPRIFRAAEELLPSVLALNGSASTNTDHASSSVSLPDWDRLYVGDEVAKDVHGAQAAGWFPVLLLDDIALQTLRQQHQESDDLQQKGDITRDMQRLEDCVPQPVIELSSKYQVVTVDSIASLVGWLLKGAGGCEQPNLPT